MAAPPPSTPASSEARRCNLGYGFVRFKRLAFAEECIRTFNGRAFGVGTRKACQVNFADNQDGVDAIAGKRRKRQGGKMPDILVCDDELDGFDGESRFEAGERRVGAARSSGDVAGDGVAAFGDRFAHRPSAASAHARASVSSCDVPVSQDYTEIGVMAERFAKRPSAASAHRRSSLSSCDPSVSPDYAEIAIMTERFAKRPSAASAYARGSVSSCDMQVSPDYAEIAVMTERFAKRPSAASAHGRGSVSSCDMQVSPDYAEIAIMTERFAKRPSAVSAHGRDSMLSCDMPASQDYGDIAIMTERLAKRPSAVSAHGRGSVLSCDMPEIQDYAEVAVLTESVLEPCGGAVSGHVEYCRRHYRRECHQLLPVPVPHVPSPQASCRTS